MRQEPRPCTGCGVDKCLSRSNVERVEHGGPACRVVTCMAQRVTVSVTARIARGAVGRRKSGGEIQVPVRLLIKTAEEKRFGIIVKADEPSFFVNRANTAIFSSLKRIGYNSEIFRQCICVFRMNFITEQRLFDIHGSVHRSMTQ